MCFGSSAALTVWFVNTHTHTPVAWFSVLIERERAQREPRRRLNKAVEGNQSCAVYSGGMLTLKVNYYANLSHRPPPPPSDVSLFFTLSSHFTSFCWLRQAGTAGQTNLLYLSSPSPPSSPPSSSPFPLPPSFRSPGLSFVYLLCFLDRPDSFSQRAIFWAVWIHAHEWISHSALYYSISAQHLSTAITALFSGNFRLISCPPSFFVI